MSDLASLAASLYGIAEEELFTTIKPRGRCGKCAQAWQPTRTGHECSACGTRPRRYRILLVRKPWGRLMLYATRAGRPISSYEEAVATYADVRRDLDRDLFDPRYYRVRAQAGSRFVDYGDMLHRQMEIEARNGARSSEWVRNWGYQYRKHVRPFFAQDSVINVGGKRLAEFLQQAGSTLPGPTWKSARGIVSRILHYAAELQAIPHVPPMPKILPPARKARSHEWLSRAEQAIVIGHMHPSDRPIFTVLASLGMRPSEASRLDLCDVSITSSQAVMRIRRTKANPRRLALPDAVAGVIREYLNRRGVVAIHGGEGVPLFTTRFGRRYGKQSLELRWDRAMAAAIAAHEIAPGKRVTLNRGCRHSFINQRIESGHERREIAAFVGNSSSVIAHHYEHEPALNYPEE